MKKILLTILLVMSLAFLMHGYTLKDSQQLMASTYNLVKIQDFEAEICDVIYDQYKKQFVWNVTVTLDKGQKSEPIMCWYTVQDNTEIETRAGKKLKVKDIINKGNYIIVLKVVFDNCYNKVTIYPIWIYDPDVKVNKEIKQLDSVEVNYNNSVEVIML